MYNSSWPAGSDNGMRAGVPHKLECDWFDLSTSRVCVYNRKPLGGWTGAWCSRYHSPDKLRCKCLHVHAINLELAHQQHGRFGGNSGCEVWYALLVGTYVWSIRQ